MSTSVHIVADAIERATRALGYYDHIPVGMTEGKRMPQAAAALATLDLTAALDLPPLTGEVIAANAPAKTVKLNAHLIASSRVAQAGARIIVAKEKPYEQGLAMYRDVGVFRIVERATFVDVADGAEVSASDLPVFDASIHWPDAPSIAYRTSLTRRQQKDVGGEDLAAQVLHSVVAGLAVSADRACLTAISAANPGTFSLGAAAARSLAFGELRGFVGRTGAGAAVDAAGTLRCAGVESELTETVADSFVGSFTRCAVAIRPEISVHFRRLNATGDLEAVVFANMLPLIPDPSAFWRVAP